MTTEQFLDGLTALIAQTEPSMDAEIDTASALYVEAERILTHWHGPIKAAEFLERRAAALLSAAALADATPAGRA